jgi:prophage regulatory protein
MKLLRLPQVKELTTLSSAGIYRLMKQGKFPKQIKIAERSSRWIESEIMDFITEKMEARS